MKVNHKFVTLILLIFLYSFNTVHTFTNNFTGNWVLNLSESKMGNTPSWLAIKSFSILQNIDSIHISRTTTDVQGKETKTQEVVSLDGQTCISVLPGKKFKKTTAIWSENGKQLMLKSKYYQASSDSIEFTAQMILNLVEDKLKVQLSVGQDVFATVYDRQ